MAAFVAVLIASSRFFDSDSRHISICGKMAASQDLGECGSFWVHLESSDVCCLSLVHFQVVVPLLNLRHVAAAAHDMFWNASARGADRFGLALRLYLGEHIEIGFLVLAVKL